MEDRETMHGQEHGGGDENAGEKTFTQDEVNEIVRKRLARERERQEGDGLGGAGRLVRELGLREQEIMKRELKIEARERLAGQGLPPAAADLLQYGSEDAFEESYAAMQDLLGPRLQNAVEVMFREGGKSPPRASEGAPQPVDPLKKAFLPEK